MKYAAGSNSTSVLIAFASRPGACQKAAVSVSHNSWTTIISTLANASRT